MRLDAITAEPRPRNAWEATDLGMAMVRQEFQPVYAAWFAVALPLFLLLHLLCWGNWHWIPWLMWWFKPLLDRAPLYILSHALFGESPTRRQFWRELPGLLRRQALAALTWRRFDLARSFTLPVSQLEGLNGQARRQRLRDLGQPGRGPAVWLTLVCLHVEIALDLALIALVWMLIPDFVTLEFFDLFDDSNASASTLAERGRILRAESGRTVLCRWRLYAVSQSTGLAGSLGFGTGFSAAGGTAGASGGVRGAAADRVGIMDDS